MMAGNNTMSPSTAELILEMKKNYQIFLQRCEALTQEQALIGGICGEWSAKEVIDHLTGWQEASPSFLQDILSSERVELDVEIDAFNQISVQTKRALSWQESLAAFIESFAAFDQALQDIPKVQFIKNPGLTSWVKAMNHEYIFHRTHIEAAQER